MHEIDVPCHAKYEYSVFNSNPGPRMKKGMLP